MQRSVSIIGLYRINVCAIVYEKLDNFFVAELSGNMKLFIKNIDAAVENYSVFIYVFFNRLPVWCYRLESPSLHVHHGL